MNPQTYTVGPFTWKDRFDLNTGNVIGSFMAIPDGVDLVIEVAKLPPDVMPGPDVYRVSAETYQNHDWVYRSQHLSIEEAKLAGENYYFNTYICPFLTPVTEGDIAPHYHNVITREISAAEAAKVEALELLDRAAKSLARKR